MLKYFLLITIFIACRNTSQRETNFNFKGFINKKDNVTIYLRDIESDNLSTISYQELVVKKAGGILFDTILNQNKLFLFNSTNTMNCDLIEVALTKSHRDSAEYYSIGNNNYRVKKIVKSFASRPIYDTCNNLQILENVAIFSAKNNKIKYEIIYQRIRFLGNNFVEIYIDDFNNVFNSIILNLNKIDYKKLLETVMKES